MSGDGQDSPLKAETIQMLQDLGSPEIFQEIVDDYVGMAKDVLGTIKDALAKKDAKGVERAAHTLKGSSATIGAQIVSKVSADLERAAAKGDLTHAASLVPALVKANDTATAKLLELRNAAG